MASMCVRAEAVTTKAAGEAIISVIYWWLKLAPLIPSRLQFDVVKAHTP